MAVEVKIPALGESVTEAVISQLLKENGSFVKEDEEILEIETEKVNQVLYAPTQGKLTLLVSVDDTVEIGQVVATIEPSEAPEPSKAVPKEPQVTSEQPKPAPGKKPEPKPEPVSQESGPRKFADDFLQEDQKLASQPKESVALTPSFQGQVDSSSREERVKMTKIRQTIARRLLEAKNSTAMLTTFAETDMSQVIDLRKKHKDSFEKEHGVRLGFMSFFVKAVVSALKAYPDINSYIDGEYLVKRNYYDIGIAISSDRGLVVPVVKNCDRLSFAQVEQAIADFANKARKGGLTLDDLQGGGFSITNGGVFGSMLSTPIVNPPQSAILGMHNIVERPVVRDGQIVIRPIMYLALSYDHRVVDGKGAISFLKHIAKTIEDPACLLIDL